jgi:SNF2 family DNA or RNA helicase
MKKIHLIKEPNLVAKLNAFPYQKEAFEAIKDLDYAAIFHEQGLGKTKIAIDLLLYWLRSTSIDTVLIVTKKQLVQNWMREFKTHTSIKPAVLDTDKSSNYYIFTGPARVVVTNFELLV